jgi:hypothetical protein
MKPEVDKPPLHTQCLKMNSASCKINLEPYMPQNATSLPVDFTGSVSKSVQRQTARTTETLLVTRRPAAKINNRA